MFLPTSAPKSASACFGETILDKYQLSVGARLYFQADALDVLLSLGRKIVRIGITGEGQSAGEKHAKLGKFTVMLRDRGKMLQVFRCHPRTGIACSNANSIRLLAMSGEQESDHGCIRPPGHEATERLTMLPGTILDQSAPQ